MEEISLRFEIVRLAVELGDYETIDLQCQKLRSLSLDDRLNEIIDLLESKNFRQALYEMKHYHQTLEDEFFSEEKPAGKAKKNASEKTWPEQGLFAVDEEDDEEERTLDLEEILRLTEGVTQVPESEVEEDEEPGLEPKILRLEDETETEQSGGKAGQSDVPWKEDSSEAEADTEKKESEEWREEGFGERMESEANVPEKREIPASDMKEEPIATVSSHSEKKKKSHFGGSVAQEEKKHPPISYIGQKFRNMIHQFPPLERSEVHPPELERMRTKIADEGYTEEEIEAFLTYYQDYKKKGQRAEAAEILLLAAATESKFAQFLLARELFKGEVLQQDHAESFTQINTLADQNFAEAICDLGQFYEYGIGIGKDREMALLLYEEAAELGVARARKHYERLKNSRGLKGLLGRVKVPKVPMKLPKKGK